jgi:integrase
MQRQEQQKEPIYSITDGLGSKHTKKLYNLSFQRFLECSNMPDSESLVIQAKERGPRFVESLIINHIRHLADNEKLAPTSIYVYICAIFHFFEMNDITINKKKISRFIPPDESSKEDDRAYTHEEIERILLKCDERARVVILLMVSTGMRVGALNTLQIKDLVKIEDYELYRITVYSNSPKDRYYTFCTPECAVAIDSYLDYRLRFGETIKPHAPLLREQFNIDDPFHIRSPKSIALDTLVYIIKQVLKRSGKQSNGEVMMTHGFRKFAITQMKKAKVDYSDREYLVGHRHSRGLDVNYDRTTEEDRLVEYVKAIDLLTINPEHRLQKKVNELESEQEYEIARLKEEMERNKKTVDHALAMIEAVKGAISAKSEAAKLSLKWY